jgi:YegS/Rv2252/BmrU family lipid kinase
MSAKISEAVIIVNPDAGSFKRPNPIRKAQSANHYSFEEFESFCRSFFKKKDIRLEIKKTKLPLDAMRFAKQAAKRVPLVIAAGGDGTINEVINGLAKSGSVLGILPLGTENAFAREFGIPLDFRDALSFMLRKKPRVIDLGMAKKRYFLMMTGVGFDAQAASEVKPLLKRLIGRGSYHLTAVKTYLTHDSPMLSVWIDDQVLPRQGYFVVAGNIKYYGGNIRITPFARPDDGYLDVCIFKDKDIFNMLKYFLGVAYQGKHVEFSNIEYFRCKRARIVSDGKVLGHTDAEIIGTTPIDVKVVPKALRIAA